MLLGLEPRREELPRRRLEHLLLVGEIEVHFCPLPTASFGRPSTRSATMF